MRILDLQDKQWKEKYYTKNSKVVVQD